MKILKISGKNLASLAGEFAIDFEQEPLASSGLFAISGPTGAGKSTLLDALCVALYDATPRLLKKKSGASLLPDVGSETVSVQDPRTLLRRGASDAWAEVDFVGNDNLRYRARWSVRRARGKAAGALQKQQMSLHRLHDQIALGGTNTEVAAEIVARIGLSFDQFTRAVLLAQNEFSAFLKTEENERGELLETLTGSAVYSAISRRAFERFRREQAAMQQLQLRLADRAPLPAEERAALEAQAAGASATLADADAAQGAAEQQLRWHQEAARLQAGEAAAEAVHAGAAATVAEAAQRRRQLALIDAVEPARALLADCDRAEREARLNNEAGAAAAAELARIEALRLDASAALAQADASASAAELALRAAAPALDQAKALDAASAALGPAHARAQQARQAAQEAQEQTAAALAVLNARLAASRLEQQRGADWLAAHTHWDSLAAHWPRWDTLLLQAAQADIRLRTSTGALAAARAAHAGAADAATVCDAAQHGSAAELASLALARQQAAAALAAIDGARLHAQRQQLEQEREALATASAAWSALAAAVQRAERLQEQAAALAAAHDQAAALLAGARAGAPVQAAVLAQAERSLQAAETACAASVVNLRATLADDQPCPVCGSLAHPWQHDDARLDAMLVNLRDEVAQARAALQDSRAIEAAQEALLAAGATQLAGCAAEMAALQPQLVRLQAGWDALALAAHAPPAPARADWLAQQQDDLRERARAADADESALRAATMARDAAQQACDAMAARHASIVEAGQAAGAALATASAELSSHTQAHDQAAQARAALLDELDAAFDSGWRAQWEADPGAFRAGRETEVATVRERAARQAAGAAALVLLAGEQATAAERAVQAQLAAAAAAAEFDRLDADLAAQRALRAALWDNRPVALVEQELADAIAAARAARELRLQESQQAAQAASRAREALDQTRARATALGAQASEAHALLANWLAQPGQAVAERAQLIALLAHPHQEIAQERQALHAIDGAAVTAAAVLTERRSQRVLHQQGAGGDAPDLAAATAALAQQSAVTDQARAAAGAFNLQLAQDDARRAQAQAMMEDIARQQQVELRWGRLNDLIGSADGKKFRNYAQQFTLDVLLGYANSHLAQLARRYRLERVDANGAPSLALLVRDQDMGGEIRSVNSLSGGESFLVSLALALGLASLSSNRVRVESLFIDEGFGSLDAETLRVAMDALDGLQSLGRKVGVISHVQEMTERIATRIVVQPAGGGTSSVTVQ